MDILLAVTLGIIQLVFAGLGIWVSLRPLPQDQHRRFISAFVIVGLLGIAVIVAQQYRNNKAQQELQDRLGRIEGTGEKIASDITSQAKKSEGQPHPIRITINNTPPDRRIPATTRNSIVKILSQNPAKAYICAPANDREAFQLASDIWGLLKDASWGLPGGAIANLIGQTDPGITIEVYGETEEAGQDMANIKNTPAMVFMSAMNQIKLDTKAVPGSDKDVALGKFLRIIIGPRPPS